MLFQRRCSALVIATLLYSAAWPVWAAPLVVDANSREAPVEFAADMMSHDEGMNILTARGNVELAQAGRILKADEIVYDVQADKVTAVGNVVLMEPNGDVHFAERMEVTDQLRDGYVRQLRTTLADGSRIWAEEGVRKPDGTTTMTKAAYTPCAPCKTDPERPPVWSLKADKVEHDEAAQRITYNDATFNILGIPVFWLPYFTHSDGTVKQKSGFLTPSFGFKSDLGFILSNSYYFALDPGYDLTLGLTAMTQQAPLLTAEYRQRFSDAQMRVSGGVTYAKRTDLEANLDVRQDAEVRGHIFADGLWNIDEKWRAGIGIEMASDDQYMRQYDFSSKDVLENEIYLERFSGRDYAVGRMLGFQDIRVKEEQTDQPNVLPELYAGFLGQPGDVLGGRWSLDISALSLQRDGRGQDLNRIGAEIGWQRRFESDMGLVATLDLMARGDGYHINDRDLAVSEPGRSNDSEAVRGFAQANLVASYPVAKRLEKAQVVIEPTAAITASPNIKDELDDIPNEDSIDVQVDATNLFKANRFPGYDRIEDQSRVTYGVRTGIHGDDGSKGEVFVGQSYRFDSGGTLFPEGSGLSDRNSDIVGQIVANYKNRFTLDYRFQLDNHDLSSRRHEVGASAGMGPVRMNAQYLFANPVEGTTIDDDREQLQLGVAYAATDEWQFRTATLHDLGGTDPGLRRASFGVDYSGECFTVSSTLDRNLTRNSSGESSTEIYFRIGLKNLGEFQTSGITLGRSSDDDDDRSILPPP